MILQISCLAHTRKQPIPPPIVMMPLQPIWIAAEITTHIEVLPVHPPYLYHKLSRKATQLRLLGMSYQ